MKRVIVIGAGMGGLASALVLGSRGFDVTVLELGPKPGGKAGTAEAAGATFDTGPSTLTLPEVVDAIFSAAGLERADYVGLHRLEHAFRYHFPDGVQLDVFGELEATLASVRDALGAGAARELADFLTYARTIWETAAPAFVFSEAPQMRRVLGRDLMRIPGLRHIDPMSRMGSAIEKRVREPHLRDLLRRYATYNGSDPRRAPATLNCIAWVELGLGAFGVEGGVHALPLGLMRAAEELGVTFRFGARAERIELDRRRVRAVHLQGGERLEADAVVSNADVYHLFSDLLDKNRFLRGELSEPSTSGWTAVVRATRDLGRAAHNVLFPATYMDEFRDLFDRERPPSTPTVYACDQHLAHHRPGWEDASPLFVMVNAPAQRDGIPEADYDAVREAALGRLRAASLIAPGDEVVWERTPGRLAARFPGSFGSIYGMSSNSMMSAFLRTPNRPGRPQGLYVASGSAHPGGGVPMCLLSGLHAARALLQDARGSDAAADLGDVYESASR